MDQPPDRAGVDGLFAPATLAHGTAHREPIGIRRTQDADLTRAQRPGEGNPDPGLSASLAEAARFVGRKPIEKRGAIFVPGVDKERSAQMGARKSTNIYRVGSLGAAPIGIRHGDGLATRVGFLQMGDGLGQYGSPIRPPAAAGKAPFQIAQPCRCNIGQRFYELAHGGAHRPMSTDGLEDSHDRGMLRPPQRTARRLLHIDNRGTSRQRCLSLVQGTHTYEQFGHIGLLSAPV